MNKNYKALELDKILDLVASETTCDDAVELARSIEPKCSLAEAKAAGCGGYSAGHSGFAELAR